MFRNKKKYILFITLLIGLCIVLLWIKLLSNEEKQIDKGYSDLETLQNSGHIRVGILQNTMDYYVDNGHVKGFQFEMVELMAKHLGLSPHYVGYNMYWDNFYALLNNKVDVLAMNLNPATTGKQFFRYTFPHSFSEQSDSMTEILPQSWALHKDNIALSEAIDEWLIGFVQTVSYSKLVKRYFSEQSKNRQRIMQQQNGMLGRISSYDNFIKKYAKERELDWRFVAAIIFQESKFNPTTKGSGGAYGLMQIMPITAQHYGIGLYSSPETQIADGCRLIQQLMEKYKEYYTNENDLLKIVLMAYNTGSRNVDAARNLAEENKLNPNNWNNIEYVLRNASDKSFNQSKTKIKGKASLKYVYGVWTHYLHYKNMSESIERF